MNPLPQRKKSPEEIAALRESLGIRALPVAPDHAEEDAQLLSPQDFSDPDAAALPDAMAPPEPTPPRVHARPQVHSFKRSERSFQPPAEPVRVSQSPTAERGGLPQPTLLPVAASLPARPVRSLKKSEQAPAPATVPAPSAADGNLPTRRHSEQELAEARRRDALAVLAQGTYQLPRAAPPFILAIGYVLAIGGAAAPTLIDWLSRLTGSYTMGLACGSGYHLLTCATLAALPVAAFIHLKATLSRHHAAFIASIVFFALVFAVLHYFPQLRHAT